MVVENVGYKKLKDVSDLKKPFAIYNTSKKTQILVIGDSMYVDQYNYLYKPKRDRLPWKVVEGKTLVKLISKSFDSKVDSIENLDITKWNNSEQIMSYRPCVCWPD